MANGMSGLFIGASGIRASQTALEATAHNLSNINNSGYTRQQVKMSASTYMNIGTSATAKTQYGIGVDVEVIRRVRDDLIDTAYRQESGRLGFYESQYDAVQEVEALMGEMEGVTFQSTMTNLWNSLNELSKDPTSTVARESLIETSTVFVERANAIYQGFKDYQTTMNTKVVNTINRINEIGAGIADLNTKISYIESVGESANDYRDQRDNLVDELSRYVKIKVKEEDNRMLTVNIEGVTFVSTKTCYPMSYNNVEGTNLAKPVWPHLGDKNVFLDVEQINVLDNNDIGELKGLIIARGSTLVDYTDVPVMPDPDDYANAADYEAARQEYLGKCDYYNNYIEPSVILSSMATLDKLVNGIVTSINDILCPETTASFTGTDGVTYNDVKVLDLANTYYGMDSEKSVGIELFSREYTDRYKQVTGTDGNIYYVRNDINATNNFSDYTLGNIQVNKVASADVTKLPLTKENGDAGYDRAEELTNIWEREFASLNPSRFSKETFMNFYTNFVDEVADTGKILRTMVNNQETMTSGYDNQRLQTEGVSSDEELQNMIKFQQAYNAASRYINVVSEMLEHIIMQLGS
ncbi:MAG: flagellar hook-associated protein FlgK [Lachnospiraceae bacterium]